MLIELIKNIENNIHGRPDNITNFIRTISIFENFHKKFLITDSNGKLLFGWLKSSKKFIKDHPKNTNY